MADEVTAAFKSLVDRADKDKVAALLSGEADGNGCFIQFHARAGGTLKIE